MFLVVVTMPLRLFVLEALASMGYTRSEIEDSLGQAKYDDVFATYLLLGRKTTDVSGFLKEIRFNIENYPFVRLRIEVTIEDLTKILYTMIDVS